jgi:Ca2+-binding RTX toxin-like protein
MPTQIGANGADNYIGTPEADTIYGAGGNDTLNAGGDNDTLNGEAGNDILTGADGNDQFVFDTALPAAGVDTIIGLFIDDNFDNNKIVLDKTVFSALETVAGNPLTAGDCSVINVAATSEVVVAGNSVNDIVYNSQTGGLFYNPNNNVAGFRPGGGSFATVYGFLTDFSNTTFLVVP